MSQQDIIQALKVIGSVVGVEAAKGILYWAMFKAGDNIITPLIAKAIQSLQQGRQLSPAEIEQLQKALLQAAQQIPQQQQLDIDLLANLVAPIVAQRLGLSTSQIAQSQRYPHTQPPTPPPPPPPSYETGHLRWLQERLRALEEEYINQERLYYREYDEARRNMIKQRLDELKREIDKLRLMLQQPYV